METINLLELYHERVAIRQFDGGEPQHLAEWSAYQELRQIYGKTNLPQEIHEIARKAADKL